MSWKYNEAKHCGVDYSSAEEVSIYDTRHQQFRNYKKEKKHPTMYICCSDAEKRPQCNTLVNMVK